VGPSVGWKFRRFFLKDVRFLLVFQTLHTTWKIGGGLQGLVLLRSFSFPDKFPPLPFRQSTFPAFFSLISTAPGTQVLNFSSLFEGHLKQTPSFFPPVEVFFLPSDLSVFLKAIISDHVVLPLPEGCTLLPIRQSL